VALAPLRHVAARRERRGNRDGREVEELSCPHPLSVRSVLLRVSKRGCAWPPMK
jgi:hypothetical protein